MLKEAIILAGGLGTRLRSVVSELPKCMAPVAGRPFLYHVIESCKEQGVEKFIFSLGYKHEMIEDWLNAEYTTLCRQIVLEAEPMGTGGAIQLAVRAATHKNVFVLNGDTLFAVDLITLAAFHQACEADCTLSLKPMTNFDRYGAVELNTDQTISSFREKQHYDSGLINGGVYALNTGQFLKEELPVKFSFEKDYLERLYTQGRIFGLVQDRYFIDIGIPEDYERAQKEFTIC